MDDEELTKLAEQELLKEARRGAIRADVIGPEGWKKCPSRNINKRFLVSTICDAVSTNKRVKLTKNKSDNYHNGKTDENVKKEIVKIKSAKVYSNKSNEIRNDKSHSEKKTHDSNKKK